VIQGRLYTVSGNIYNTLFTCQTWPFPIVLVPMLLDSLEWIWQVLYISSPISSTLNRHRLDFETQSQRQNGQTKFEYHKLKKLGFNHRTRNPKIMGAHSRPPSTKADISSLRPCVLNRMQRRRNRELERQGQAPATEPREPQEEPQNDDVVLSDEDYEGHFFATELPADNDATESTQTMGDDGSSGVYDSEDESGDAVIRSFFAECQIDNDESSDIPQCPPSPRPRPVVARNRDEAKFNNPKSILVEGKVDKPQGRANSSSGI
jgi:hypothetical protein